MMLPTNHPFNYDLGLKIMRGVPSCNEVTICCHGYGHNSQIVEVAASYGLTGNLVGFNFPDHDLGSREQYHTRVFGTIDELLPLLYLLKYYACDLHVPVLNLYGFSAGGGAIINALAVLNRRLYETQLQAIGISEQEIVQILIALQKGYIILDCPLKSVEEIIALRGASDELEMIAHNYARNNMRPIDTVRDLSGLNLHIILNFQCHDDILGNRDDAHFIERLEQANSGTTKIIFSNGQHNQLHKNLWDYYKSSIRHCAA